eukprot:CAMPEP_0175141382 /NCGR_PEP_ID=MMETSP0087-20121206/12092_1 /TAXON_ID=136419 /ORGANISM="Unknown Unknown, Strain D1" /LENGTH=248 /DNA_ID=CAMNT_0016424827 /DNA_START=35 /DNA_END=781 /DNA_ORIENTATION=+
MIRSMAYLALLSLAAANPALYVTNHGCRAPKVDDTIMGAAAVQGTDTTIKVYKENDASKTEVRYLGEGNYTVEVTTSQKAEVLLFVDSMVALYRPKITTPKMSTCKYGDWSTQSASTTKFSITDDGSAYLSSNSLVVATASAKGQVFISTKTLPKCDLAANRQCEETAVACVLRGEGCRCITEMACCAVKASCPPEKLNVDSKGCTKTCSSSPQTSGSHEKSSHLSWFGAVWCGTMLALVALEVSFAA